MNEVLDRIERELTVAIRRTNVRRGRRRSLTGTTATGLIVFLTAGIGFAAVSGVPTPVERLLGDETDFGKRPGTPRLDLQLTDPGGLRWTATTYFARNGIVASTSAPAGLRDPIPSAGGASGFIIADNLLDDPLASLRLNIVRARGAAHYLFSGNVDARARSIVVVLAGERRQALISSSSLTVPVDTPRSGLTAEGRRRAARMPEEVSLRSYAASFTPDLLVHKTVVRATVKTTLADRTSSTQQSGPLCVSRRCGVRFPRAG